MRNYFIGAVLLCALLAPASATAAAPDGLGPWADFVVSADQGERRDGSSVLPARSDPNSALGVAERTTVAGTFYSLGFGGQMTLGYENNICNGSGADLDLELVEATKEPHPPELVDVYVSLDGVTYTKVASAVDKDAQVAFSAAAPPVARFVRLVDVTSLDQQDPNDDAYDVDGVRALNTDCVVAPPPRTGTFSCKASALRVGLLGLLALEPAIANKQDIPCESDEKRLITIGATVSGALAAGADADVIFAKTTSSPGDHPGGLAEAGAAKLSLLGSFGVIKAQVLTSRATVSCDGTTPKLAGSSQVVGLVINGRRVVDTSQPLTISLGLLGSVRINSQVKTPGKIVQRALWIDLLDETLDVVVARSQANFEEHPCG